MGATLSSLGALLKENVESGAHDLLFREADLLMLIARVGRMTQSQGSAPFAWNVVSGSNGSVEEFSEGQAPPASGQQTYLRPSLNVFGVRAVWGITGHARDNAVKGGFYSALPSEEEVYAEADVMKKIEDVLCGSTQDKGIASIIDAGDTYAGLAPGSYAQWASEENAVGGALTLSAMDDLMEELTSATSGSVHRGASPDVILAHPKQIRKYSALAGAPGAANNSVLVSPNGRDGLDLAFQWAAARYQGIPIVRVRTLANSEMYFLEGSDLELIEHRPLTIDKVSLNSELIEYAVSTTMCLKVRRRNKHGKMTGLT